MVSIRILGTADIATLDNVARNVFDASSGGVKDDLPFVKITFPVQR